MVFLRVPLSLSLSLSLTFFVVLCSCPLCRPPFFLATKSARKHNSDMALYKSPVAGTKKVRLGASTCVSALPSELVGILLENAAMLGPDYIDEQWDC